MRIRLLTLALTVLSLSVACFSTDPGPVATQTQVTLSIFSGRPDPSWTLGQSQTDEFMRKAYALPASVTPPDFPPSKLGYRGFRVQAFDASSQTIASFTIYGGIILREQNATTTYSADLGRAVERWLLASGQATLSAETYAAVAAEIG
jgi:hypothetical protein